MSDEILKDVSCFNCLCKCLRENEDERKGVKVRVGEELENFDAMKKMCNTRSVGMGVKRELCGGEVIPTVTSGAETWERLKHDVVERKGQLSMGE